MVEILLVVQEIIYYLAVLFFCWPLLEVILQMFQQNRYELRRYSSWLTSNLKSVFSKLIFSGLVALVLFLIKTFLVKYWLIELLSIIAFIIAGYLGSLLFKPKNVIKPLAFTNRVKRQLGVFVIVDVFMIYLFSRLPLTFAWLIAFLPVLNYWLVYVVALITYPLEKHFQQHFLNETKDILRNMPNLKIVGITGSYGKTSTKNIVNEVLSQKFYSLMTPASFNTPMGIARTVREHLRPIMQTFVCEMGADKQGEISFLMDLVKPSIGILTAIGPAHLATFGSLENIVAEKMQIIEKLPSDGIGILNYDNNEIANYQIKNNCKIITYGIENQAVDYYACEINYQPTGSSFVVVDTKDNARYNFSTKLLGHHNISNILAAICAGRTLGIDFKELIIAVNKVKQITHRLEVKPYFQHTMIDDAFNSNPAGAKMALDVLKMMPNERVLITCGMIDLGPKQYELNKEFGRQIKGCADYVILVGQVQTLPIKEGLEEKMFPHDKLHVVASTKEALALLPTLSKKPMTFLVENDLPDAFNR